MSSQTIYIKIDKNVLVHNRNITLGDIAKIECTDVGMLRKIRQKKVYSFQGTHAKKNQFQVFSILKIIQLIHEDYPNADVQNEGEADFIVEYVPRLNPPMGVAYLKTILLCIVIFFGSAFTIMAFNFGMRSWKHSDACTCKILYAGDGKRVQWIYGTGSVLFYRYCVWNPGIF